MKKIFILITLVLSGCGWSDNLIATVMVGSNVGSLAAIQRTVPDAVYSLVTGRDCSMVRLEQGKTYCRLVEPRPEPPRFCTRSLGQVDCWREPETVPGNPRGVADGRIDLTAEQEADRVRRWPW